MADLYLPDTAVWRQASPRGAGATAVDGGAFDDGRTLRAFIEPRTPREAENKYGVVGTERPHFFMFDPLEAADVREGDEILWNGLLLYVRAVQVFPHQVEGVASGRRRN